MTFCSMLCPRSHFTHNAVSSPPRYVRFRFAVPAEPGGVSVAMGNGLYAVGFVTDLPDFVKVVDSRICVSESEVSP